MKNREELHDKNKKKLKNYNIHIGKKVGDRKETVTKIQRKSKEEKEGNTGKPRKCLKSTQCKRHPGKDQQQVRTSEHSINPTIKEETPRETEKQLN